MKLIIASDIHGSAYYCRHLLGLVDFDQPSGLLLLGDLLYHGPRNDLPRDYAPMEVARMLNALSLPVSVVRGNCDAEIDQAVLNFPIMADYILVFDGTRRAFVTHGHLYTPEKLPRLRYGDAFISGHTHVPVCEKRTGALILNPGSVSIPKEGSPHSAMSYENGRFEWFDVVTGAVYKTCQWEP